MFLNKETLVTAEPEYRRAGVEAGAFVSNLITEGLSGLGFSFSFQLK